MRLWFANLILYSAALTVAGCYVPFTEIGSAVMKMLADTRRIKINDNDKKELTEKFSTMPPYSEVPAALLILIIRASTSTLSVARLDRLVFIALGTATIRSFRTTTLDRSATVTEFTA